MSDTFIEINQLSKDFDVSPPALERWIERSPRRILHAVDKVSFHITRGETFALVGESGSGKSTIGRMAVGLLTPSNGDVKLDQQSLFRSDAAKTQAMRRRIQMIFQDPYASLNPRWRTGSIIAEPLRVFNPRQPKSAQIAAIAELLQKVGLSAIDAQKFPHEFSGGQRQRIAIARALAANPDFIVCDEPTSALDVSVQAQILNLMRDLQEQFGLTYLLISHNLAVVRHMARRIGVIYLGRLVEVADASQLFTNPRHPYTRMLLAAVPDIQKIGAGRTTRMEGEVPNPINPPSGCHFHPRCPLASARCTQEAPEFIDGVACHAVARPA